MVSKIILATQRVDTVASYGELRDALDEKWCQLLYEMGYVMLPIPNHLKTVAEIVKSTPVHGILLTGGNDPVQYGGTAKQRDAVDEYLLRFSEVNGIPLVGVCRGMQSIGLYYGGVLERVEQHVAVEHEIHGAIKRVVNSYHNYVLKGITSPLEVVARSSGGEIEAIRHEELPIWGIMWHPERVSPFAEEDIKLLKEVWK